MFELNTGSRTYDRSGSAEDSFCEHNRQMKDFCNRHKKTTVFDENDHFEPEIMTSTKPLRIHLPGTEMRKVKRYRDRTDQDILVCTSKISGRNFKKN